MDKLQILLLQAVHTHYNQPTIKIKNDNIIRNL